MHAIRPYALARWPSTHSFAHEHEQECWCWLMTFHHHVCTEAKTLHLKHRPRTTTGRGLNINCLRADVQVTINNDCLCKQDISFCKNQSALRSVHQLCGSLFCHVCPSTKWHALLGVAQKSYQLVPEDLDRALWAGYSIISGCVTLRACQQSHCLSIPLLQRRAGVMLTLFDFGIMARI